MPLTLVILAAGKGRRFGGDKPLAAVGPSGQSLFEYSIYDAFNAGFKHVVFVVSEDQHTSEYSDRLSAYGNQLKIEFVVQAIATPRIKPWGTAHAVLVCQNKISNPFVVITADDYYGRLNFEKIGNYLLENSLDPLVSAMPGYKLENTMSHSGSVNRGICSVGPDGYLVSIHEGKNISHDGAWFNNDSIVSMTFWGFHPSIFTILEIAFQAHLAESTDLINDEFYIPKAVDLAIKSGMARVKVFQISEKWKGVTYAEDVAGVREYISELTDAGFYPIVLSYQNAEHDL